MGSQSKWLVRIGRRSTIIHKKTSS